MSDDRGLVELTEALHHVTLDEEDEGYDADAGWYYPGSRDDLAAAILGDRGVFWPTGTDEYRELIHQYQARIAQLDSGLRESAGARHAIGHAGQEVTGDIITFDACQRAGCVSARAALEPTP